MAVSRVLHEKRRIQNVKRIKRTNKFHYTQSIVLPERLQIVSIFCLLHFTHREHSNRHGTNGADADADDDDDDDVDDITAMVTKTAIFVFPSALFCSRLHNKRKTKRYGQ